MLTFQNIILKLQQFWQKQGCILLHASDIEVGAGTLNKHTFLRVLGSEPWKAAYVEPCRRPTDGRYGKNQNRLQHYYQFQVILKPFPQNIQDIYINSLKNIGLTPRLWDLQFLEDNWEHPALGATGLGWEVWCHGMEITQFTYFQQCGSIEINTPVCEITYGLERIAMCIQNVTNIFDIVWASSNLTKITYGEIHKQDEIQWSFHNFKIADINICFHHFDNYKKQATTLLENNLPIPAYDYILKCSHLFNILDARKAISHNDRHFLISEIRHLAQKCAEAYLKSKQQFNFTMEINPYESCS
ncbi:MAG: glycine--tRNA ligase subunit alpha [Deltaproteobacteria bacterium]|nr:MAG: glycine--tRNA ligase subunit alpha [Deltaproteobacteria bacterium]